MQQVSMNGGQQAPDVCVVLTNWNGANHTIPCVESLRGSDYPNFHILVVDDGSTDGSPERIGRRFPDVEILRQPANMGVSKARNRGIARAAELGSDYVVFLDNDTKVDRSLISHLVTTARAHDNAVAVGPKIYYLHDRSRLWFAFGQLSLWTGIYRNPVFGATDQGQFDQEREMEVASSCCLLVPTRVLQVVGGFDPNYTWNEDVDWSLRCRRAGFPLVFCPRGRVWHEVGGSSQKQRAASMRYLLTRNQLWTFRKVVRPWQMVSISIVYPFRAILRILAMIAGRQWECIPAELRGAKEGLFAPLK
jgi:GT2 family glycosyltransferase